MAANFKHLIISVYRGYRNFQPFTDAEAWGMFRIAALAEALGWTLLIIGIICDSLPVSWHHVPVAIAGRLHGIFFLLYLVAAIVFSPSLRWSVPRMLLAVACSVPPYGSLVYEIISGQLRHHQRANQFYRQQLYRSLLAGWLASRPRQTTTALL